MRPEEYVLVRSGQDENVYGRFVNEILKAEGLNGFRMVDVDKQPLPDLSPTDMVILTRCFMKTKEMDMLSDAVEGGTRLVVIHPQENLARRFGWEPEKRAVHPGWVRILEGYPGAGIPIQTHVPIPLYAPDPGLRYETVAVTVDREWKDGAVPDGRTPDGRTPDGRTPAAVKQKHGKGMVVLFFYDLAKAVARIRFGDPDLASLLTVGLWGWPHAGDLFSGHLDYRVSHLPQADFHGQLLAEITSEICAYPLLRFWYYERPDQRSAAVFTSDEDGSTPEQVHELAGVLNANDARASFYLMKNTRLDRSAVDALRKAGHAFGPHINPGNTTDEWCFDFPRVVAEETGLFEERFGGRCRSIQCHLAPWHGYMRWVPDFMQHGYRMLMAYLSLPLEMLNRFMCGSGRPMKFTDQHGSVYDCWQQPIILFDDTALKGRISRDPGTMISEFGVVLEACREEHHSALGLLSHPINFSGFSRPLFEPLLKKLKEQRVPVYSGDAWCEFQDRRYNARLSPRIEESGRVSYSVDCPEAPLSLMAPFGPEEAGIRIHGRSVKGSPGRISGRHRCIFGLEGGKSEVVFERAVDPAAE